MSKFAIPTTGECAPDIHSRGTHVCSSTEAVDVMRSWLRSQATRVAGETAESVVNAAKEATGCASESCLYKQIPDLPIKELDERFRPQGPWDSKKWLNNENIDNELEMYMRMFSKFCPLKYQMRDFQKFPNELRDFDWADACRRYDSVACAFNTDLSTGPGQHWVAFFADIRGGTVEFFDSTGNPPCEEFATYIVDLAHRLSQYSKRQFRDVPVTDVEHQKEDTDCGVYTLYYIICRLHGVPKKAFTGARIPDSLMNEFRQYLFRHS